MDALNYSLPLDHLLTELMSSLSVSNTIFLANRPREISENVFIPKPLLSTISNWLSFKDIDNEYLTKQGHEIFNSLCVK